MHVYFSVVNWLFPERVGKKYKAKYCVPLNGEYVIDVDAYLVPFKHRIRARCVWGTDKVRREQRHLLEHMRKWN
jgi:hypothetical protein